MNEPYFFRLYEAIMDFYLCSHDASGVMGYTLPSLRDGFDLDVSFSRHGVVVEQNHCIVF